MMFFQIGTGEQAERIILAHNEGLNSMYKFALPLTALATLSLAACASNTKDAPMDSSVSQACMERSQAVFFSTGSANLDADANRELATVADFYRGCDLFRISVAGYADSVGNSQANLDLSDRRADAVLNDLLARGVTADRISIVPLGEATTFNDGNPDAFERRVVVTLTP